ncbi:hypothetical protein GPALN_011579 [Globodera pallida]|nr:hypothetical protein GPALN_011579 [Globodera pallida]
MCVFSMIYVQQRPQTGPLNNVNASNDNAADEQFSAESLNALFGVLFTANFSSAAEHKKSKPISSELLCNAQENSMCENARMCRRKENASDFECICRKGHAGKFCQFSLFARNCADAFAFHEEEIGHFLDGQNGGVWQLDVDGSAPLPPTFAECKMINDGEVATVVANNVPAGGAVVRTVDGTGPADAQNVFFPISYKLFSASQLGALIARSFICRQNIRFACEQSPLAFKENRTWLEVVSRDGKQHRQIGTHQQFSCACRNKELYGCGRDNPALACYCDDLSQPSAVDQATLYNASAGVSAVYFRASNIGGGLPQQQQHQKQQHFGGAQNFTLGPLECSGEAGTSLHGAAVVTLRSPSAGLGTGTMGGPWRQLEFDFRTGQPDIDQMVAGWDPDDNGLQMKISLRAGYRIELTLSHQASMEEAEKSAEIHQNAVQQQKREIRREMSISIASQRPLNDLFWHRVLVEVFRGEIRFSVDRLNAFQPLSFPFATSTKFTIGGDEKGNGFVGCLGNFQIDRKLLNWHEQLAQKEKDEDFQVVASGCLELCAEHKCEQDSKCVEHFDTESTSCACKLPRIHYGEHCEKNINANSSATFRGGTWGFLRFFDLPVSALHSDVIFSVRTDQRRALFLYEHDHADNFVQIHLADEYRIVLTLNNLSKIVSCSLFAPPAKTFNDMRWLQLVLERNAAGPGTTTTILHVDDDQCEIGPTLLNDQPLSDQIGTAAASVVISDSNGLLEEAATNDDGDAILPPAPPVPPEKLRPFHMLYVGGMPRAKRLRRERRERLPVYLSNVPQLRGCIRGLLVDGEKVDMREAITNRTLAHKQWDSVQIGCEHVQCDQLHCQNGGQCSVNWNSANSAKTIQCDCARSSFTGENCTDDIGLSFIGNSSVVFDMAEPKRFAFFQQSDRQTLSFAYAVQNGTNKQRHAQQLATIYFEDGREFHVVLDRNGSLFVGVFGPEGPINVQHIIGIFNDGLRHQFLVHFLPNNVMVELLELYGTRRSWLIACEGMNLANAQRFYFGGRKNVVEKPSGDCFNSERSKSEEAHWVAAVDEKDADHADANSMPADGIMPGPEHNPDSNLLADAMRQILARSVKQQPPQQLDLRENGIKTEHLLDKLVTKHLERTTIWWPQQIDHFIGSISSALIVFERDVHKLTFTPFLYYFQKSELLHRNVFNEPPSAEEPLAPTGCGQFKVPEKAKKAQRNVSFPVWEAPFGPIPFHDEVNSAKLVKNNGPLTAEKNGEDHEFARWLLILLLLIILSAFCLFLIAFLCRQTVRQLIGRTYILQKPSDKLLSEQKRPMLKVETNGPVKRRFTSRSDSLEPIQLAQHKRFFPLEGSFCGIAPAVTPTAPPEPPKPGASILRNFPVKIQRRLRTPVERERAQQDCAGTAASSSTVYFTAQEEQFAENGAISSSSPAISFKSLDDPAISSAGEESTTIGQAFDENAPELFDENTLQLSTALSSSIGGSSHFSSENSIGGRGQKLNENHLNDIG